MSTPALLKRDWKRDHVYLIQFPRAGCVPSPSTFSLKLETWLRLAKIPYTNISNDFSKRSSKGLVPFIELNGRQIADSSLIIEHLIKEFHKESIDDSLTSDEKAVARAFHALIEDSLRWVVVQQRSRDFRWLATEKGFLAHFSGFKKLIFQRFYIGKLQKNLTKLVYQQGIGRHSIEEILEIAEKDLTALESFLGEKKFLFGDKATTLDCTAFGHLCQLYFPPLFTEEIKTFMNESTPRLIDYIQRMKGKVWPDWDEATKNLTFNTYPGSDVEKPS